MNPELQLRKGVNLVPSPFRSMLNDRETTPCHLFSIERGEGARVKAIYLFIKAEVCLIVFVRDCEIRTHFKVNL